MIWGYHHFWKHPYIYIYTRSEIMDFLPCKNETYLFVGPPWFHRGQTERVHFLGNLQACNLHFWRHLKTISRMVQLVPHRLKQFWILETSHFHPCRVKQGEQWVVLLWSWFSVAVLCDCWWVLIDSAILSIVGICTHVGEYPLTPAWWNFRCHADEG